MPTPSRPVLAALVCDLTDGEILINTTEAKMYTPSMEGMLPVERANFIHRTYQSHFIRRLICTAFPLAEAFIVGFLMYVGKVQTVCAWHLPPPNNSTWESG